MRCPRAFTLIELLIVVAIIAILAAIAVPNFLEAQTRSKVSRAKSDIRSMATALESYKVDNNKYPPSKINPLMARAFRLTTPVSYMSTIPIDIFNPGLDNVSVPSPGNNVYTIGSIDGDSQGTNNNASFPWFSEELLDMYAMQMKVPPSNLRWVIFSYGPMLNPLDHPTYAAHPSIYPGHSPTVGYLEVVYDPSNGTISKGIVPRVGP